MFNRGDLVKLKSWLGPDDMSCIVSKTATFHLENCVGYSWGHLCCLIGEVLENQNEHMLVWFPQIKKYCRFATDYWLLYNAIL